MYLMNFLFDFKVTTGLFSGDRREPKPPLPPRPLRSNLFTSVNWLKLNPNAAVAEPNPLNAGFNPEPGDWDDLLDMDSGTLLVQSTPPPAIDEGNVGVRIGLDPDSKTTPGLTAAPPVLTISVCFGKPAPAGQRRASPFYVPPGAAPPDQLVQTTFVQTFAAPVRPDVLGNPTWFFPIGLVRFRPIGSIHRTHRYEFSVGIIVDNAGVVQHYSHDPDMDVGP